MKVRKYRNRTIRLSFRETNQTTFDKAHAKLMAIVDLPTPPLQLDTAMIFLTLFVFFLSDDFSSSNDVILISKLVTFDFDKKSEINCLFFLKLVFRERVMTCLPSNSVIEKI